MCDSYKRLTFFVHVIRDIHYFTVFAIGKTHLKCWNTNN